MRLRQQKGKTMNEPTKVIAKRSSRPQMKPLVSFAREFSGMCLLFGGLMGIVLLLHGAIGHG